MIVVAIIAVLVAIAVPLFTGEITNAREQTFNANYRAAKSAVVTAILKDGTIDVSETEKVGNVDTPKKLYYDVLVDKKTGDITTITANTTSGAKKTASYKEWQSDTNGKITVEITQTDLKIESGS